MRPPRIIVPPDMDGLYHVVSRVVDRRMIFGEEEKRKFRELLVAYAGFSGIEVVAWCLMDKRFHLLLHVPSKQWVDPASLPEKEVLRRLAGKSEGMSGSTTTWGDTSDRIEGSLQANGGDGVAMRFGHWGGLRVFWDLRVGLGWGRSGKMREAVSFQSRNTRIDQNNLRNEETRKGKAGWPGSRKKECHDKYFLASKKHGCLCLLRRLHPPQGA